jgi:hypothetical protein
VTRTATSRKDERRTDKSLVSKRRHLLIFDGKARPITLLVLLVGSRQRPYELPRLALAAVLYGTAQQVRVAFGDAEGTERGIIQDGCYCVPTAEHLARAVQCYGAFQSALTRLATILHSIGAYAERLREACGITDGTTAPTSAQLAKLAKANDGRERLSDQLILAPEPDKRIFVWNDPFKVPDVSRGPIVRHTPVCYQKQEGSAPVSQSDTFPCVGNTTWERVHEAHAAAVGAQTEWLVLLDELGTYKAAAHDKRYASLPVAGRSMASTAGTLFSVDNLHEEQDNGQDKGEIVPPVPFDHEELTEVDTINNMEYETRS